MIDRALIGRRWPPVEVEIEKGRLQLFAKAIGETNPIYVDEAAAKAAGFPSILAPPTFASCLWMNTGDVEAWLAEMGLPMGTFLHGEQTFTKVGQLYAGERLLVARGVKDIYTRKGGALEFLVIESLVTDLNGKARAAFESVLVVRHAPATAGAGAA